MIFQLSQMKKKIKLNKTQIWTFFERFSIAAKTGFVFIRREKLLREKKFSRYKLEINIMWYKIDFVNNFSMTDKERKENLLSIMNLMSTNRKVKYWSRLLMKHKQAHNNNSAQQTKPFHFKNEKKVSYISYLTMEIQRSSQ